MEEPTNYLGAAIFWLYNVFAFVFTGITLRTLYHLSKLPRNRTRNTGKAWLFTALAALSFTTLSTNMLKVLIQSFNTWSLGRDPAHLHNLPLAIWQWSTTSSLFRDFGEAIVLDSARFFWVQNALLATLSIFYYMGTEGRHRNIPQLWSFFCLSQILPISFAQNLFYIALILSPEAPGQLYFNKSQSVLSAAIYCLCLACAQLYAGTEKLVPIILGARLVLMAPLFLKAGRFATKPTANEKTPVERATGDELQRIILKSSLIMTGMKAYQALQEGFSVPEIVNGLGSHPAVMALGCDFFVSAVSFAAWTYLGPRSAVPAAAATGAAPSATTTSSDGKTSAAGTKQRTGIQAGVKRQWR